MYVIVYSPDEIHHNCVGAQIREITLSSNSFEITTTSIINSGVLAYTIPSTYLHTYVNKVEIKTKGNYQCVR